MERIERAANLSIMRGCGFATLGIGMTMVALSHDIVLAGKTGAILFMIVAIVLYGKGLRAPQRKYQKTELWMLLERRHDLAPEYAQRVITNVLRDTYMRYRDYALTISGGLWVGALAMSLVS